MTHIYENTLREILAEMIGIDENALGMDTPFSELGLDSLDGLRYCGKIRDRLCIEVEPEWLYDYPSLSRLSLKLRENGSITSPFSDMLI